MNNQQPDLSPPEVKPSPPPSWKTYIWLMVISIGLILLTFILSEPDWPALMINLASGIITTVILIIIIDKHFRRDEVYFFLSNSSNRVIKFFSFFSDNLTDILAYAKILENQILAIRPSNYIETYMDEIDLEDFPYGFILIGQAGIGKTTFIQHIAWKYSEQLSINPIKSPIPVIIPVSKWRSGNIVEQIYINIHKFYPVRMKVFQNWIRRKPMLLMFDGIDEYQNPKEILDEIESLQKVMTNIKVIVTSRLSIQASVLPTVVMPFLAKQQTEKQLDLVLGSLKNNHDILELFFQMTNGHALTNVLLATIIKKKFEENNDIDEIKRILNHIKNNR
jgi:hypothetical protein